MITDYCMMQQLRGKNWQDIVTFLHLAISNNYTQSIYPFHLRGFQYLKDINLPRFNPSKTMNMILSGKISHSQIEKSSQYEESVKPHLEALIRLRETLEQDFQLHSYMPRFYSFTTQIKADYLISSATAPVDFIFIIKSNSSDEISMCDFVCCSAFMQTKRDYRENQRPRSILKKERVHIATNTTTILFDRLNKKQ